MFDQSKTNEMNKIVFVIMATVVSLGFWSCESEGPITGNAVLESAGVDCGWIVKFNETQTTLPASADNRYILVNLYKNHQLEGIEVYIEAREAVDAEILVCTTLGIAYPQIFITKII